MSKKVVMITGASRGIGHAAALKLCNEHRLVLLARNTEQLTALTEEVTSRGGEALAVKCDLTVESDITAAARIAREKFGQIDVLVNNAGVGLFKRADEFTTEEFNWIYQVNLLSVFQLTREIIPDMIKRKRGQIINIASVAGLNGFKGGAAYAASKFALMGFTESLREDVKQHGIAVSAICPGGVNTTFGDKEVQQMIMKRDFLLEPEDVAHSIAYLVGESENANTKLIELKPRCREEMRE